MKRVDLVKLIDENARSYRLDANASLRRNAHMNERVMGGREDLPQEVIDSLLVDFVNYVAAQQGIDYALYTKDYQEAQK